MYDGPIFNCGEPYKRATLFVWAYSESQALESLKRRLYVTDGLELWFKDIYIHEVKVSHIDLTSLKQSIQASTVVISTSKSDTAIYLGHTDEDGTEQIGHIIVNSDMRVKECWLLGVERKKYYGSTLIIK